MEPKKDIDQLILETLASGYEQKEIHDHFKKMGIKPNSVSLIEKRIKAMKAEYRAKTLFQLALIVKRKGLI
jgi:hypothetical protein